MSEQHAEMKSIWYLVGLMLLAMGVLVLAGGVTDLLSPPARATILGHLRPNLWWGCVMIVAGALFFLTHRK
jgi:FtsH-binding integral membrane protein